MNRILSRCGRSIFLLVLAVSVLPLAGEGQATGTPTFYAPTRGFGDTEIGVSASDGGGSGDFGIEGRFAFSLSRTDISLRAGYVDSGNAGSGGFVAGVEVRMPVIGHDPGFPLDGAFVFGLGRTFGDIGAETLVPLGLSLGRRLVLDGPDLQITPYIQPTVILQSNTAFGFGLGLDIHIRGIPEIRLNWAEGDLDGFSVSLFWAR